MLNAILLTLVVQSEFIFDRASFPSSHASTIVETREGLVAAWFGGTRERDPDVGIWVSRRDAAGWTAPVEVANGVQAGAPAARTLRGGVEANSTRHPSWNPVLFQPSNGPLVLFYKIGPTPSRWWGMARTSPDGGRTWSAAITLPPGILGPIRAKPIEISPGVMLAGSSTEHDGWVAHMERFGGPWDAQGLASAAAWQKSGPLNAKDEFGAIQPAILLHSATEIQILLRSRQRVIAEAWSKDGGVSWGRMTATTLPNPSAGIDALRLADGRFLLIYNPSPTSRAKLALAVSGDGKAWRQVTLLEDETEGEFSYPAMIQSRAGRVHITYTWRREKIKHVVIDPATIDKQRAIAGTPAVPVDPITGILETFKTHDVVALSEGNHGNEQGHAFRLALIRDPRFAAAVNDIVVEFGNALYQDVIDRFVQGKPVAYEELRKVWQDTTQRGTVWDRPIYEAFYRAVRDVNATLPVERQLRVLLGDPPIDWYAPARSGPPRTDDFPVSVIQREVLAKNRRALVIFGGMHLIRKRTPFLPPKDPALAPVMAGLLGQMKNGSIVAQLDQLGARVFVISTSTDFDISTVQANVVTWRRPSLALIRETPLGLASSVTYYPRSAPVIRGRGGVQETLQLDLSAVPPMQEVVDAILYLGPPSAITQSRLSKELCTDPAYLKMRLERLTEFASPGHDPAAMFKAECAAVLQR